MASRADSDESYVIDLCDEVIGARALRQHRFPWLLGDPSPKSGRSVALPVDAYWPSFGLVVEYYERQHHESVHFFDKPDVLTVSGVNRGEQRRLYDLRRAVEIPRHSLALVTIDSTRLAAGRRRMLARDRLHDLPVVQTLLSRHTRA